MIAAKDPQEFIPSGRQQLLIHPGPTELHNPNEGESDLIPELLFNEFQKVSLTETKQEEWWIVRKSPHNDEKNNEVRNENHNKSSINLDINKSHLIDASDNSWTWKSTDVLFKTNRRFSDNQKRRSSSDNELNKNMALITQLNKKNICCKSIGFMEEELYVKDNVVIWSKGLTGNSVRCDNSRVTLCSYTSQYPVKHARWCTFYCERPSFSNASIDEIYKSDEPSGTPLPSVCIVDDQNMKVFTADSEDFVSTLPFQIKGLWNTKYGILLEKKKGGNKNHKIDDEEDLSPSVYSLAHPLEEVCPVAIRQGSVRILDDLALSIVFTCEKPSICMLYDVLTGQHSVYRIRKLKQDEQIEVANKLLNTTSSLQNLSDRLRNRLSFWDVHNKTGVSQNNSTSRAGSISSGHSHIHHSRSHSPMAQISRCQSPVASPLMASNPWVSRISCIRGSFRNTSSNISATASNVGLNATETCICPSLSLCFDHIWSDTFTTQCENTSAASKVFLSNDLVGQLYLCYLIPSRSQLSIVRLDDCNSNFNFGILTSISAKDAVAIHHLHMLAILEHSGSVVLYSGLTMVGKLHVGGVLAQHIPSPSVLKSFSQFNTPFPRRSTMVPNYGTPISSDLPQFEDHLLSPIQKSGKTINTNIPLLMVSITDKTQLSGLRDAVEDRLTLQYSDGTYYRITLPTLASSTLVENCLNALRQTLQKDIAITLLTRWYATRNTPGSDDLTLELEWNIFVQIIFELLGYENDHSGEVPLELPVTPANSAKRQRPWSLGTDSDWNALLESEFHKKNSPDLNEVLHLKIKSGIGNSPCKHSGSEINTNAVLFPSIRIIHFTLHLLYEELKLNIFRNNELPLLAQFLSKLAFNLNLKEYEIHYWKDFPDLCTVSDLNVDASLINMKNILYWSTMSEKPENIMEHIYDLLNDSSRDRYPFIPNVNIRSKCIVELCGTFIKGRKYPEIQISIDDFTKLAIPFNRVDSFSTPKSRVIDVKRNISEKVVILMTEIGITSRDLDSFPEGIGLLLYDALWQCRQNPPTDWPTEAYNLLQRPDLATQAELTKKSKTEGPSKKQTIEYDVGSLPEVLRTIKQIDDTDHEDGMEDIDSALLKLRFPDDHRVTEARRLLQSSKPVPIALVQRPDVSDHDFIEEQEKHLYVICARTMALPVGRGMFTLRTAMPVITEPLPLPKLCLTGKACPRGITVELGHIDYPQNMQHWPLFHNGVANGLRISPDAHNIDSTWIIFNKPKNSVETSMEHAGFLMALGLNGHLTNLTALNTYDYLSKMNEMTSIGVILGLSSATRGTSNAGITKILSIHVEALLPPTSMELDVPQNVQVAALLGVGLVYQGSAHRHMTEVLLTEIGRPPGPEMENSVDRESYSLAAGLALGLITLRHGGRPSGLSDLNVPDTLHYYMVGGNKRPLTGAQKDKYKVSSFQIREGSTVNLDITSPAATIALGLMYLGTGNKAVADWMTPPGTQYLLDFIRPDFLMLRILAKGLIMWNDIEPTRMWVENQVPESIRPFCMVKPTSSNVDIDYEAMNQAYCNIVAGACFAIGLKYAGSANEEAFTTLLHICHVFTSLTAKSIAELAGKPTIETCLNVVLISASMVMAGTGNLEIMRIVRHLRRRVGIASSTVVTYGSHLATHMALGLLFLGGGRYTLSNSPASVAALICAFYPKFPTHSSDNRYHLQAFRHLYVLAVEPRLVIPKDVVTGRMCYARLRIVQLNGSESFQTGPCLIPDLNTLSKIAVEDTRYWTVVFERGRNWDQLLKLLESCGFIEVKQRAGCLSYLEDKFEYRSQLARTLTHSRTVPWHPLPKAIVSFSSDCTVRYFTDNFLISDATNNSSTDEDHLLKDLTSAAYECVIKDKETILHILISLIKVVKNLNVLPSTVRLWQFKLVATQVLHKDFSLNLISPELILAFSQKITDVLNKWEDDISGTLHSYIYGDSLNCNEISSVRLANYVVFYDLPFGLLKASQNSTGNVAPLELLSDLSSKNYSIRLIEKIAEILNIIF